MRIWVSTVFILISLKTEIARSARGQNTRAPCTRRNGEAENFGDLITADHKVLGGNCESRNNHRYAVVEQDLATQWIQAYPCKNKNFTRNPEKLAKPNLIKNGIQIQCNTENFVPIVVLGLSTISSSILLSSTSMTPSREIDHPTSSSSSEIQIPRRTYT